MMAQGHGPDSWPGGEETLTLDAAPLDTTLPWRCRRAASLPVQLRKRVILPTVPIPARTGSSPP